MDKYVAKPYVAASEDAEVLGQAVLAFADNLRSDLMDDLLPKHGLGDIDPEAWYPHQAWLNVLKDIEEREGGNAQSAFVAFGKQVVKKAAMPPEIDSIPVVLNSLHAIHHINLRNVPDEDGYAVEKVSDNQYRVYENTPNPSDAIYGFIWELCSRFRQSDERFRVVQIDNPKPEQYVGTCFEVTITKI